MTPLDQYAREIAEAAYEVATLTHDPQPYFCRLCGWPADKHEATRG